MKLLFIYKNLKLLNTSLFYYIIFWYLINFLLISYNKNLFDLIDVEYLIIFKLFQLFIGIIISLIKLFFQKKIYLFRITIYDFLNIYIISKLSLFYNYNCIYGIKYVIIPSI